MRLKTIIRALLSLGITATVLMGCTKSGSDVVPATSTTTTSTTTGTTTSGTTTTTTGSTAIATNLNNTLLLKLVNDLRAKGCNCGVTAMPAVNALTWNDQLAAAALAHSNEMNTKNYFSHNSFDGSTFDTRVTAAGYKWMAVGENIAAGQTSEQEVFTAWLNSEGHCKNMMSASFKEMGAARAGNYWTQDFGAK
ncbi:CAP domain-containing protein [Mucilaginibacter ginkgonis]|uniref:CAP domain-containing protein n=1 Tax=Mucilaginibacter ginkgonis TaxID=2682091 RepID=A0A7T7JHQ1_9SPHI|nr:CAP domain-containing protein [Mucilaginibacter ginkgonis]QQL50768.1 CAP domain-containing protein [Mucilaginibacter ginkgonis]